MPFTMKSIIKPLTFSSFKRLSCRVTFATLLVLNTFASPSAVAERYNLRFEHAITDNQLPIGETNAIFQDHMGFMWFGGSNGLARYDGVAFQRYLHNPKNKTSISHDFIWDILEDSQQTLWVATPNGLNRFNRETNTFTRFQNDPSNPDSLSNNDLYTMFEDSDANLWLGTRDGLDLFNRETGKFSHFRHDANDQESLSDDIVFSIHQDKRKRLWIGTQYGGLNLYDPATQTFSRFNFGEQVSGGESVSIRNIKSDVNNTLWLATDNGLYRFEPDTGAIRLFQHDENNPNSLSTNRLWSIFIDNDQTLWITSDHGGLNIYNPATNTFSHYRHNPFDIRTINSDKVRDVYQDTSGNFWVALFPSGVDYINLRSSAFKVYRSDPADPNSLLSNAIDTIHSATDENIWVGTESGASLFNPTTNTFTHYVHQPTEPTTIGANAVLAIEQDAEGNQWFGTWSGGLNLFDPVSQTFQRFKSVNDDSNGISSDYIWALLADSDGNLWVGNEARGLDRMNIASGAVTHFRPNPKNPDAISHRFVRALAEDTRKNIWVGTLIGLNRYDSATDTFETFFHDANNPNSIVHDSIFSLFVDSADNLWIGTEGGLSVLDAETQKFTNYTTESGLPHNYITSITEDQDSNIWLTTLKGISKFDRQSASFENINKDDGIAGNIISRNAAYHHSDGNMYIGSTQGLTVFNPHHIESNKFVPPIRITDFRIFNKAVAIGGESPLSQDISLTKEITLNYDQSMISFEFAALNYQNPEQNLYAYKLEGFDKNWIEAADRNTATYTNLNAGSYLFKVKGSNDNGVWNEQGTELRIIVLPPFWLAWWAYLIYLAIGAAIIYAIFRSQRNKIRAEQAQVEYLRSLDKMKDEFLANTSHELRTPLNGIIGLTESLIDEHQDDLHLKSRSHLKMIAGSARRLSNLINDILDFSRIKTEGLELHLKPVSLEAVCNSIVTMVSPLAEKKDLDITLNIDANLPNVLADEDRLQQILYNLIGNAIKFTHTGHVRIGAVQHNNKVQVSIEDTGIGIPDSQIENIFDSFAQGRGEESREFEGTGLGLTVAKNLVELHRGAITVTSEVDRGSTFTFELETSDQPLALDAIATSEIINKVVEMSHVDATEELVTESPNIDLGQFHILVVDDDPVNRQVLISQLSLHNYRISEAADGFQAIEVLERDTSIDLILLDVMMPRMTGYETALRIRATHPVHDLPIIFVTAKHLASDLVKGFVSGGNDFLVKPISKNELLSRVKTHLQLLDITRNLESLVNERTNTLKAAHMELERLDNVVTLINRQSSMEGLVNVLLKESVTLFKYAAFSGFWLIDDANENFRLVALEVRNNFDDAVPESIDRNQFFNGLGKWTQSSKEGVYIVNPKKVKVLNSMSKAPESVLVMTIQIENEVAGLLIIANMLGSSVFQQSDIDTMKKLHSHAVSAVSKAKMLEQLKIQNQQLELASYTDQLTGLHNRRHLLKNIAADIAITSRKYESLSSNDQFPKNANLLFILIDIDHFKQVNDTYGHISGDMILKQFSELLTRVFRTSDYIIRWGGEEFMVIVRFCDRSEASQLAERFRREVKQAHFEMQNGLVVRKTCSVGYSYFPFYQDFPAAFSWEQVVDIADRSLYVAKNTGRNAWVGIHGRANSARKLNYNQLIDDLDKAKDNTSIIVETSFRSGQKVNW